MCIQTDVYSKSKIIDIYILKYRLQLPLSPLGSDKLYKNRDSSFSMNQKNKTPNKYEEELLKMFIYNNNYGNSTICILNRTILNAIRFNTH